ncbi:methionyl-tRNA formyltransferase [Lachnospiraceae bacterium MD329]|nr:methionyl-tRNA formyltransferase [Lachnospiraceae bacterium MD329]
MKILFIGTPDFASTSLKALLDSDMDIVGVVSQPDKPKGRGHKLVPTEVKSVALEAGLKVFQPLTLKDGTFREILDELKPDLIIVVAYGNILPDYIIEYPKYGCVNVHASLLPKYRGSAPIQWAIINGERVTGVTTMKMDSGVDTGDMLLKAETEIGEYETSEELFDRLAVMGGELLIKTVKGLEAGTITPVPQNHAEHTYAPMISRETGIIDWTKSAREISKLICGLNSWPLASTLYKGETLKIVTAAVSNEQTNEQAGKIVSLDKGKGLKVACGEGTLYITTAQFPNSKKMNVEDYARGHSIEIGTILG